MTQQLLWNLLTARASASVEKNTRKHNRWKFTQVWSSLICKCLNGLMLATHQLSFSAVESMMSHCIYIPRKWRIHGKPQGLFLRSEHPWLQIVVARRREGFLISFRATVRLEQCSECDGHTSHMPLLYKGSRRSFWHELAWPFARLWATKPSWQDSDFVLWCLKVRCRF